MENKFEATIPVVKVREDSILPAFSREGDACMDCYADIDTVISPFTVENGAATAGNKDTGYGTTMRWVQVFPTSTFATDYKYTTAGTQTLGTGTNEKVTFSRNSTRIALCVDR